MSPTLSGKTVLISGAGVAGPALAYWLHHHGFLPTVVERAPALREGGQAVDFRGPAHLTVLRRMGLLEHVRALRTPPASHWLVDAGGACLAALPAELFGGDLEIQRGDLCRVLHDATRATTTYRFGDWITCMVDTSRGVEVEFAHGPAQMFDLVVGADGLRSAVRAHAFGADAGHLRFLGHHVAGFSLPDRWHLRARGMTYSEPGRGVMLTSARTAGDARALLVFTSDAPVRLDLAAQKSLVAARFAGLGGPVPGVLAALADAGDLYFDAIARVELPRITRGRIALVGDAAFGGTLGGQGTGAALIAAYILASELAHACGDHRHAFARYESRIRAYATRCQRGANHVGGFFAPRTRAHLWLRNHLYRALSSRLLAPVLRALATRAATDISLDPAPA